MPPAGPPAVAPSPSLAGPFEAFLPEARGLAADRVVPLRLDPALLFANVQAGVLAVLPHKDRLLAELPRLRVAGFEQLPDLARAVLFAAERASRLAQPMKRAEIEPLLAELQKLREVALLQAEVFVLLKLLPAERVAQIRAGKGAFDAAQDGVALADLYHEHHDALAGKHGLSAEQLRRLAELGHTLMQVITPDGARPAPSPEAAQAVEDRNRLFTLLTERHAELRKAGFYLYGESVDDKVPILGARLGHRRSEPAPEPAPPVPAPSPDVS